MVRGLTGGHDTEGESVKKMGLFSLKKRMLRWYLTAVSTNGKMQGRWT